jgi:hypothetical protein
VRVDRRAAGRDADDLLVGPGEVGEVVVPGPVVSPAYADRPEATAAAKLDWDGQVAHRMGDLASWDDEGRLWFAGRKAHVVHTADGPLHSVPCEEVFNLHPAVRPQRADRTGPVGRQTPVLVVQLEPGQDAVGGADRRAARSGAADPRTAGIARILYRTQMPVDVRHNSKIDRPKLGRWAAPSREGPGHWRRRLHRGRGRPRPARPRRRGRQPGPWRLPVPARTGRAHGARRPRRPGGRAGGGLRLLRGGARGGQGRHLGAAGRLHPQQRRGHRSVLAACRQLGIRKLVHTSTPSVVHAGGDIEGGNESLPYAEHADSPYARTKAVAEQEVLAAADGDARDRRAAAAPGVGPGDTQLVPRIVQRARTGGCAWSTAARRGSTRRTSTTRWRATCARWTPWSRRRLLGPGVLHQLGRPAVVPRGDRLDPGRRRTAAGDAQRAAAGRRGAGVAGEGPVAAAAAHRRPADDPLPGPQMATAHWFDISAAAADLGYAPTVGLDEGFRRLAASLGTGPAAPAA